MTTHRVTALLVTALLFLVAPPGHAVGEPRSFDVSSNAGLPGTPLTVSGQGWRANSDPVQLYAAPLAGGPASLLASYDVTVDGNFTGTVSVPPEPPGQYELYACQPCDPNALSKESQPLRILAPPPTLSLDPGSARVDEVVSASGQGWTPGELVEVSIPQSVPDGPLAEATVAEDGSFQADFRVPALEIATYEVVACERCDDVDGPLTVSASLTVEPTAPEAPTVSVAPSSGRTGTTHRVSGTGWLPEAGDVLLFASVTDSPFPERAWTTATPAESGTIEQSFVQPSHAAGPLTLFACQRCADPSAQVAAATGFTVIAPPVRRPELTVLPATVREGETLTATGGNWAVSNGPVLIFADQALRDRPEEALAAVEPEGGILPPTSLEAALVPGEYVLYACQRCPVAGPFLSATATLTVTAAPALEPTMSVSPQTAEAGATVQVTGTGWSPGRGPVSVFADGDDITDPELVLAESDVDAAGQISATLRVGDGEPRSYRLFACQDCGSPEGFPSAEATLTVEQARSALPWVLGGLLLAALTGTAAAVRRAVRSPPAALPRPWLRPCADDGFGPTDDRVGTGQQAAPPSLRLVPYDDRITVLDQPEEP